MVIYQNPRGCKAALTCTGHEMCYYQIRRSSKHKCCKVFGKPLRKYNCYDGSPSDLVRKMEYIQYVHAFIAYGFVVPINYMLFPKYLTGFISILNGNRFRKTPSFISFLCVVHREILFLGLIFLSCVTYGRLPICIMYSVFGIVANAVSILLPIYRFYLDPCILYLQILGTCRRQILFIETSYLRGM